MRAPWWAGAVLAATVAAGAEDAAGPRLVVEPASFDFGNSLPEKSLEKEFVLRNVGTSDLQIESVTTTCGCTVAEGWAKVVKPGGRTPLRVVLKTPPTPGRTEKSILIRSNDKSNDKPVLEVKVSTTVVPPLKR